MGIDNVDSKQKQQSQPITQPKPSDSARTSQGTPVPKGVDQSFQKLLESTTLKTPFDQSSQGQGSQQAVTERAAPQVQEQFKDEGKHEEGLKRNQIRDKEDAKDSEKTKESGVRHTKAAEQKVTGRPNLGERGQRGDQQGGHGGEGGFGGRGSRFTQILKESGFKKGKVADALKETAFLKNMQEVQKSRELPPTKITQEVVNQIVAYIHVLTRKGTDKEVDIKLRENFFKGLKVKVTKEGGKVVVTFLTDSRDVQSLFASQKDRLKDALSEKNIDVSDINVILA